VVLLEFDHWRRFLWFLARDALDATINVSAHSKFVEKWLHKLEEEDKAGGPAATATTTADAPAPAPATTTASGIFD